MNRRNLIQAGLLSLSLPLLPKILFSRDNTDKNSVSGILKPKVLQQGDTIGIIAPATAVPDPDELLKVQQVAGYFGLNLKFASNVLKGSGYKTRSVEERLDDLHEMFDENDINAVFCIRGGYGSAQLLDKIDYDLIRDNPKIFIGYSDITAMHLAIHKTTGLVTFHGPVMLSAFNNYTIEYFKKALFTTEPIGKVSNPVSNSGIRPSFPFRTITPGIAKGRLLGGNLSIISSLMGTPYEIDTKDKILFIEDVGEDPYRIDRMLTQLNLAGKLKTAAGIVFGKCSGCEKDAQGVWDSSLGEVLDFQLGKLNIPVFYGLMFGHTPEQITIPYGIEAEINAEEGTLNILEAAVSDV